MVGVRAVVRSTIQVAVMGVVLVASGCVIPPDYYLPRGFSRTYRDKLYAQPKPALRDYAAEEVRLPPFTPSETPPAPEPPKPAKPVKPVEYLKVGDPLFSR